MAEPQKTVAEMSEPSFCACGSVKRGTRFVIRMASCCAWTISARRAALPRRCGSRAVDNAAHRDAGTALAALIALPLAAGGARTLNAPRPVFWVAKGVLDDAFDSHAGVRAVLRGHRQALARRPGYSRSRHIWRAHWASCWRKRSKRWTRSRWTRCVTHQGDGGQVFFLGVWPAVLPQYVSQVLYVWEFNIRDSTILGLVGAGGLGLLLSEAMALFQWGRLATLLIAIVIMVTAFDAVSRAVRRRLV